MSTSYRSIAFTENVRDAQSTYGSRAAQRRLESGDHAPPPVPHDALGPVERQFLTRMDGFYIATVSDHGWPYVQFRGGPPGFVRTPDQHTLAWADFRGNRQYVTAGNLAEEGRVAMIFLDYAAQTRLKVYGHARIVDIRERPEGSALAVPGYPAASERDVYVDVAAYDWNCPQHIVQRFTLSELSESLAPMRKRVDELETENVRLRAALDADPAHARDI